MPRELVSDLTEAEHHTSPEFWTVTSRDGPIHLLPVAPEERNEFPSDLIELAWPVRQIRGTNVSFQSPLEVSKPQFIAGGAMKHYHGTVGILDRSVAICGDATAQRVWSEFRSRAGL